MKTMPLYHSCPTLLGPGSIVLPGNYGRIIREVGPAHPLWSREQELERVRTDAFPDKPSRLDATFACTTLDTARFYANLPQVRGTSHPVIYEVEKVDAKAPEHRADFNVVQPLPRRSETMTEIAALYWAAALWATIADNPNIRCEELVTPSALRIIKQV
jgi:hypothetical protein